MKTTDRHPPTSRRRGLRGVIRIAAMGLAFALGAAVPSAALAGTGNIDPDETGSITVHKYAQPEAATGLPNDGTELDADQLSGLTPLAGVQFSVQRVALDLTDSVNWQGLADMTVEEATALGLTSAGSITTNGSGTGSLDGLPVGLYLVTETSDGGNPIAIMSEPFLVSIPTPVGGAWLYDVHVYPKNALSEVPIKTVDDSGAHLLGDTVTWTIQAQVPQVASGDSLSSYIISDELDSRLAYVDAEVSASFTGLATADYVIAPGPGFSVTFTDAGLAKLSANPGAAITVVVTTTVQEIGDGAIANSASLTTGGATTTSDPATTSWGALQVTKVSAADEEATLDGAVFDLHAADASGAPTGDPLGSYETEGGGLIQIAGLKTGQYVLVETRAPNGYVRDDSPRVITISTGDTEEQTITNAQVPAFQLPLTGGYGIWLYIVVGLALVGAGIALNSVRRKRASRS